MGLRRTASFLSLDDYRGENSPSQPASLYRSRSSSRSDLSRSTSCVTLQHYKEQREQRKIQLPRGRAEFTIAPQPSEGDASTSTTSPTRIAPRPLLPIRPSYSQRTTSPLSPSPKLLPPRASFPRSKREPDLYRMAIQTRMRCSPEGEKILMMGPRCALSILSATRDLEKMVSYQSDDDFNMDTGDQEMLTKSWIMLPPHDEWDMLVDGRA